MEKLMTRSSNWRSIFNGTNLKIFAAILMLGDHIYEFWYSTGNFMLLHMLGRMVFPIFLFLSAEGFHYTKSKKVYIIRMLIAGIAMTVISMTVTELFPNDNIVFANNAFKTFCTVAVYMLAWDYIKDGIKTKKVKEIFKGIGISLIPIVVMVFINMIIMLTAKDGIVPDGYRILLMILMSFPNLMVEGGAAMVLLGLLFYIFRENRIIQVLVLVALSVFVYIINKNSVQWMMVFAAIPMLLYNGEKGRGLKYFFYIYYPVHLVILYLIATFI